MRELSNGTELIGLSFVLFSSFFRRPMYSFFPAGVGRSLSVVWAKQGFRASNSWYGEIQYITSNDCTYKEVQFLCIMCVFCTTPASLVKVHCSILSRMLKTVHHAFLLSALVNAFYEISGDKILGLSLLMRQLLSFVCLLAMNARKYVCMLYSTHSSSSVWLEGRDSFSASQKIFLKIEKNCICFIYK